MKNFLILASILLSGNALARGVVVKCWEVGAEQTEENLVYQHDGGYIHDSLLKIDGKELNFDSATEECIDWDFPKVCEEQVSGTDKRTGKVQSFTLVLASIGNDSSALEPMIGHFHAAGKRAIALSCTREAL